MGIFAMIGGFLRGVPLWVWAVLALLAAGWLYGQHQYGAGEIARQAQWDAAIKRGEKIARATEDTWRGKVYDLAFDAEKKRLAREAETDRTIAAIRSGALRVRDRFTCPRLPTTPGTEPATETGGLRPADAEFLVRFSDESDTVTHELNQCIASYNALKLDK